jgi:hypothetical protein
MEGAYKVRTDDIRAMAITCHALDVQFDALFNRPTICDHSERLHQAYDGLYHASLLQLAISIRVSLSQEDDYHSVTSGVGACGQFEEPRSFSAKDVCDKIIHAKSVFKPVEEGVHGACAELRGTQAGTPWIFGLSVSLFSEWVLAWLDRIEESPRS